MGVELALDAAGTHSSCGKERKSKEPRKSCQRSPGRLLPDTSWVGEVHGEGKRLADFPEALKACEGLAYTVHLFLDTSPATLNITPLKNYRLMAHFHLET